MSGYIPDGYTIDGVIHADPGLYEEVAFSYRPMVSHERRTAYNGMRKDALDNPVEAESIAARAMADHLVEWDLMNGEGKVPIDRDHLLRLQPNLSAKLFRIIAGVIPPDYPEDTDEETDLKN